MFMFHFDNFMRIAELTEGLSVYEYKQYVRFLVRINL